MAFRIIKMIVNRALAPFGYILVNQKFYQANDRDLQQAKSKLAQLTRELKRQKAESEELRLRLGQAIRADLQRQFDEPS